MAVDDAVIRGAAIRKLIASRIAEEGVELGLPELVSVIDGDLDGEGDLTLEGAKIGGLNGVDGAKIIVGEHTEIVIKNH